MNDNFYIKTIVNAVKSGKIVTISLTDDNKVNIHIEEKSKNKYISHFIDKKEFTV